MQLPAQLTVEPLLRCGVSGIQPLLLLLLLLLLPPQGWSLLLLPCARWRLSSRPAAGNGCRKWKQLQDSQQEIQAHMVRARQRSAQEM
jgi:hypothetical protein